MHTASDKFDGEIARQARHIASLEAKCERLSADLAAANRTLDALEAWAGVHDMGEE